MVYNVENSLSDGKTYTLHTIPKGYSLYVEVNGQKLFYNRENHRLYNPATGQYHNKGFEKAAPSTLGGSVLDSIVVKPPPEKPVYNGRQWEKVNNFSSAALKKFSATLWVLFTVALASLTGLGGYATFALLVTQGNLPVGFLVGFLTAYFAKFTYQAGGIALEKIQQKV